MSSLLCLASLKPQQCTLKSALGFRASCPVVSARSAKVYRSLPMLHAVATASMESEVASTTRCECTSGFITRREGLMGGIVTALASGVVAAPAHADDFVTTASGLKVLEAKKGDGETPKKGDTVVVHWSAYTSGYQGKRVDNTSVRDEPFVFTIGNNEVIAGFEEAVLGMNVGGLRRIEIPGELPELSYPRDRKERFTDLLSEKQSVVGIKYRYGPQPSEFGGQRALDFVLDNPTLQPFNRNLVFDIRLLNIRGRK